MVESEVKAMGLAEFGCKELFLAEREMLGLAAFGPAQLFKGLNRNRCLRAIIQTGVFIEALQIIGATVRD